MTDTTVSLSPPEQVVQSDALRALLLELREDAIETRGRALGLGQITRAEAAKDRIARIDEALATPPAPVEGVELARHFHDTYERLAPSFGYETREETKVFDRNSPNGRLMIAVCTELAPPLRATASPAPRV